MRAALLEPPPEPGGRGSPAGQERGWTLASAFLLSWLLQRGRRKEGKEIKLQSTMLTLLDFQHQMPHQHLALAVPVHCTVVSHVTWQEKQC